MADFAAKTIELTCVRQVTASRKTTNLSCQLLNKIAVLVPRSGNGASALCCILCPLVGVSGAALVWRSCFAPVRN